jgi:hypothetical protein
MDKHKADKNKSKFAALAHNFSTLNAKADAAAKKHCITANLAHHPEVAHNDPLIIFSPLDPQAHYSSTLHKAGQATLIKQFTKTQLEKASRWLHTLNDLTSTKAPLHSGHRGLETFLIKLLNSALPTKPTVRRSNWIKTLTPDHPKVATYNNDNCNSCDGIRESHKHIFDECPSGLKFKQEFMKNAVNLVNNVTKKKFNSLPWWFNTNDKDNYPAVTRELVECRVDLGWRGFIPNALYNTFILHTSASNADKLCKELAILYAKCNLNIWKQRCRILHNRTPSPTPPPLNT